MDVLTAAWVGSGRPPAGPSAGAPMGRGACARCGKDDAELVEARKVVSKYFTAYDGWVRPSGPGVCNACAWAYTTPDLRKRPHLVTSRDPSLRPLSLAEVFRALAPKEGLLDQVAVIVPLKPGRKHLMPAARWGMVTLDDAHLVWTAEHAGLLRLVAQLRRDGFGSRMLMEESPPFSRLAQLPRHRWGEVISVWDQLARWRTPLNPYLALALHITLKEAP